MTTLFNAHTQGTGEGSLSSREGKRNRKAQALSALLSASALGVFLEGCSKYDSRDRGSSSSSSSSNYGRTCYSDQFGNFEVPCDSFLAQYYSNPLGVASASASDAVALSIEGALGSEGGSEASAEHAEQGGDAVVLGGSASDDFLEGRADTASYADADVAVIVDLSADTTEGDDTEGDALVGIANLVGSAHGDSLTGNAEANALYGSAGADVLEGGEGTDTLVGGAGADTYVFAEGDGADTIVEVVEEGVVNTVKFEGDYQASDFSFERSGEDGTDLVIVVDTDGDDHAENEVTLDGYFVSEASTETAYSIEVQINNEEAFVPAVEG